MNFFLISIALFFVVTSAEEPQKEHPRSHPAPQEQVDQLPDFSNPEIAKKLKCSACKCLTREIHDRLSALDKLRHGTPKHFEVAEKIEALCKIVNDEYGLLMRNNKPTLDFSRNAAISRLRGNWINTFLVNRCNEIVDEHENDIVKNYKKNYEDFKLLICRELSGFCSKHQLTKEEL